MSKLRNAFMIVGIAVGVLVIVLVAGLLYGAYKLVSPPQRFEILSLKIIDNDGYPSLRVAFNTSKYELLRIELLDDRGNVLDYATPEAGQNVVSLSLAGLKPYTNIVGERNYTLLVLYGDKVVLKKVVTVRGVKAVIKLDNVAYEWEEILGAYYVKSIVLSVRNVGDAPMYVYTTGTRVYINGEEVPSAVEGGVVTVLPGEERRIAISTLATVKSPSFTLRIVIKGDRGDIEKVFSVNLGSLERR